MIFSIIEQPYQGRIMAPALTKITKNDHGVHLSSPNGHGVHLSSPNGHGVHLSSPLALVEFTAIYITQVYTETFTH